MNKRKNLFSNIVEVLSDFAASIHCIKILGWKPGFVHCELLNTKSSVLPRELTVWNHIFITLGQPTQQF